MSADVWVLLLRLGVVVLLYLFVVQVLLVARRDLASTVGPQAARLVVVDGGPAGPPSLSFILHEVNSLGRDPANSIQLPDPSVSAAHALLVWHEGRWRLEDLRSTNGTAVNGRPIRGRVRLAYDDLIQMGAVQLRLERL